MTRSQHLQRSVVLHSNDIRRIRTTRGQPWDLLLVSAAALILISVARLHVFLPGLSVIRPGLLASVIGLGALVFSRKRAHKLHHLKHPLGYFMVFFVVWAVLGAPFGIYPGRSVRYLVDHLLREALVILVLVAAVRDLTDLKRLLAVFGLGVIAFAALATGAGDRAVGGGGYDPNDSAMFVASGVPLIFFCVVRAKTILAKLFFGFGLVACGTSVVVSGSRGGFLALAAVTAYCLLFLRGIRAGVRIGVAAAILGVVVVQAHSGFWDRMRTIGDSQDYNVVSYTGRLEVWKRGLGYMAQNPVLGVGIHNFPVAEGLHPETVAMLERGQGVKFSAAHSIWIQTAAELGLPGILALIGMFIVSFRVLWSADRLLRCRAPPGDTREVRDLSVLGRPLMGILLGVIVAGSFLSRAYSSVVWMPLGLTLAVVKIGHLQKLEIARAFQRQLFDSSRADLGGGRAAPILGPNHSKR